MMKVHELIARLEELPEDLTVTYAFRGFANRVETVELVRANVWAPKITASGTHCPLPKQDPQSCDEIIVLIG